MPQESKFQPPGAKERIMQEILATKTLYDAEFDRIRKTFGPMLADIDGGQPRQILFVDPLKVASARAYGIDPEDFIKYQLEQQHLKAASIQISLAFNNASFGSVGNFFFATGTNPMAIPVLDEIRRTAAEMVIPKTHLTDPRIKIPGMTQAQLTSYVNYHEFFHCMHDKYAGALTSPNTAQKREMFADVCAMMEMIRQGESPKIIDSAIAWRETGKDAQHATVPALEGLKAYIAKNGVDSIRKLNDRQMLDLGYKITNQNVSGNFHYWLQELGEKLPDWGGGASMDLGNPLTALPGGWNPTQVLEDKAMAMGRKITPKTLMEANNALQAEYAALRDKHPDSQRLNWMMILMEDTYVKRVTRTDYEKVNKDRGAALTDEDRQEIAFVKATKSPVKTAPIFSLPKGPSS